MLKRTASQGENCSQDVEIGFGRGLGMVARFVCNDG
jgi:hypothetical protein